MPDLNVKTGQGPGGEWYVQVPDGHLLCLVSREMAEAHSEWRECCAVRIVTGEGGTVGALEVCADMDWLTSPEAEAAGRCAQDVFDFGAAA